MSEEWSSAQVLESLSAFTKEREWEQFHRPDHLAKSVAVEAGELLECFQWSEVGDQDAVASELADVLTYAYLLAAKIGRSPEELILEKLETTRSKYPVAKARGRSTKYDRL
ncbi:nucleotide pyrophosphohydrolase [Citricoccus muralis]|uniref:Nucleotide pyrophosphohydrolase n=1 Tax=Citricoccus muralis TaxID=169134 RepID=A0ABY8H8B2_9MICC|nr:nucleotide pyrophosphohydrolase [Citricoccus muralis]WFP16893.1 nucleotide pyrophosphohydrolase [Citricoccus muralis]